MKLNPYLNFIGNAEAAFQFYQSVFGGELTFYYFKDMLPDMELANHEKDYVMHVGLPIGAGQWLMGSDCLSNQGPKLQMGNNNYISISPDSREDADKLFQSLSAGGEIEMPMEDMFWGDYYGSFKDQFGVYWMITFNEEEVEKK